MPEYATSPPVVRESGYAQDSATSVRLKSGRYYTIPNLGASLAAPTQSRLRIAPITIPHAVTADRIASDVTTAAASSTLRWVVYSDDGGYPGTNLLDTGASGDSTTTGVKEATISLDLSAGRYWLGVVAQGGNPTLRSHSTTSAEGVGLAAVADITSVGTPVGFFLDSITGAAPATFTAGASAAAAVPQVWLRVA